MASLTNTKIKDTYDGLLKTTDNDALGGTYKLITDGLGNSSGLYLGTGGRLGIGTSSPDAKLDIEDTTTNGNIARFRDVSGTSQQYLDISSIANGMQIRSAYSTGINNQLNIETAGGSSYITLSTNSTERMRINSSGNVGIGTSSPDKPLVLSAAAPEFKIISTSAQNGANAIISGSNSGTLYIAADAGNLATSDPFIWFGVSDTERMRIDSSGNLILFNSSLSSPTSGFLKEMFIVSDDGTGTFAINGASNGAYGDFQFITRKGDSSDPITALTIDSSGNVGIGSSSIVGKFEVNIGSSAAYFTRTAGDNGGSSPAFGILTDSGDTRLYSWGGAMKFYTAAVGGSPSERMRITSGGDVLIGTQTANCGGAVSMHTHIKNDDFVLGITTGSGASKQAVRFANDTTAVGSINLSTTSTSYNTSSDYRLKENVVDLTGALDRIDQLEPKRFNFIADEDTTVDGFLAHEVQDIVPEAVTGEKDAVDDEGNPQYQGIDQSKIVPLLVGAIKELKAEIETLKSQINS